MILQERKTILLTVLNTIASGNMFAYIAKNTPWEDGDVPPEYPTQEDIFSEPLLTKRISSKDLRVMIERIDWEAGEMYSTGDIVITQENNVYEAQTTGQAVVMPTWTSGTDTEYEGTISWKYLFYLDLESDTIFSSPGLLPVSWNTEELFWTDKAKSIRISYEIVSDENGFLPIPETYRIAGLYANPFARNPRNNLRLSENFTDHGVLMGIDTFSGIERTNEQVDRFTFEIPLPEE